MLARGNIENTKAVDEWIKSYKTYWYKNNCADMVYRSNYTTTQKKERVNNCVWMWNNFNI
jgi:hypothetical protein